MGWYKRAYIAALRQAKFYLLRQAAAAAEDSTARALRLSQYTSRSTGDTFFHSCTAARVLPLVYCSSHKFVLWLVHCGSCIAAATMHEPQYTTDYMPRALRQPQ